MQPDFPAAHSMDTDWFAVDREGHVAICSSGEPGPVPVGILNRLPDRQSLKRGAVISVRNERVVPVVVNGLDETAIEELHESSTCRGCTAPVDEHYSAELLNLYCYEPGEWYENGPYQRVVVPSVPMQFAQLPPAVRQFMHPIVFPHVSFADAAVFQPLEHMPCQTWGRWSEEVQYLASDLKTLRRVPRPMDRS